MFHANEMIINYAWICAFIFYISKTLQYVAFQFSSGYSCNFFSENFVHIGI